MSVLLENLKTGDTAILHANPDGTYPNIKLPWMVKGAVISTQRAKEIVERQETKRVATINVDDKLNKLAAMMAIPAADVLHVVGRALGIECAFCQLRFQIWQKAKEIGWRKVIWLTWKSVRAQVAHDDAAIEAMAKELES